MTVTSKTPSTYSRDFSQNDADILNRAFFNRNVDYLDIYKGDGKWSRVTIVDIIQSLGNDGQELWYWYMETKPVAYGDLEDETTRMLATHQTKVAAVAAVGEA